jgi:hypothetical protein
MNIDDVELRMTRDDAARIVMELLVHAHWPAIRDANNHTSKIELVQWQPYAAQTEK